MAALIFLIAGGVLTAMGFVEGSKKVAIDSFVPVLVSVLNIISTITTHAYALQIQTANRRHLVH